MSKGILFGNRILAWYSIDTLLRVRDNFRRMGMNLDKVNHVVDKSIEHHVSLGWGMVNE